MEPQCLCSETENATCYSISNKLFPNSSFFIHRIRVIVSTYVGVPLGGFTVVLAAATVKEHEAKSQGKGRHGKVGRKPGPSLQDPLTEESYGACLIPPPLSCNYTCEKCQENSLGTECPGFIWGWSCGHTQNSRFPEGKAVINVYHLYIQCKSGG